MARCPLPFKIPESSCPENNRNSKVYALNPDDIESMEYEADGKTVKSIKLKEGAYIKELTETDDGLFDQN